MVRVRSSAGRSAIAVCGPDPAENRAFLSYSASFRGAGLPVPEIYGADEAVGVYLAEDLGDTTLFDALTASRSDPQAGASLSTTMLATYRRVLTWLARFQVEGGRAVDYGVAYPTAVFDRRAMLWDLNYFKYHFLKLAHIPFHEAHLQDDFEQLSAWLEGAGADHFMYRDLQSRNVMLREDDPWFIDYQGGLQGPLQYDPAKFLYEGKAGLSAADRSQLLEHYLEELGRLIPVDREKFLGRFRGFVVLRILQGMGAYGYLGLYGRKPQFLARIPPAIRQLEGLLETGFLPIEVPELRRTFERLVAHESLRAEPPPPSKRLTVRVGSFSYKRGIPVDPSGHGGGFAFDCRALPNPGRLAEFAGLSGLDPSVSGWLREQSAVEPFFQNALGLVEAQVRTYAARGFDSLAVHFGCTGGQHRSVHLAERMAGTLEERFPDIDVPLDHAEWMHWPATAARPRPGDASPASSTSA
jgi:aminoglycoside/choline kinase family phosphotransferase